MTVASDRVIIGAYTDDVGNRTAITLYYGGPSGTHSGTDYVVDVVMRNQSGAIVTTTSAVDGLGKYTPIYGPWAGAAITVIDPEFYDLMDVTNAPHYSGEVQMSNGDATPDVIAIILKKGNVVVDVLGDPNGTTPLLSKPGVMVRNSNFDAPQNGYLASDWNVLPPTFQYVGYYTGNVPPLVTIAVSGLADQSFGENSLNDHAELFGSGISLTSTGLSSFSGGKLTVSFTAGQGAADSLSVLNSGDIQVSNASILYQGTVIGTVSGSQNGSAGSSLEIYLNGAAVPAAVQALLRALAYANTSDAPGATRTVKISLTDGKGHSATDLSATITVHAQNDAPTIGGTHDGEGLVGGSITITTSMLNAIDPDNAPAELTFEVTGPLNGNILVDGNLADHFTLADVIAGRVTFKHDGTQTTAGSFTVSLKDASSAGTGTATVDLTISRLNHAPVGNDRDIPLNEDDHHTFSLGDFAFMDPDDSDLPNQLKAIVIVDVPATGNLTFKNVAVWPGQEIPADELGSLVYAPPAGANGPGLASFHVRVKDDGGTVLGGVDTSVASYKISFDVASLNDAPTSADGTVSVDEDGSYTFALTDFAFSDLGDASAPNSLTWIVIGDLPTEGVLELNGTAVTTGQVIAASDIGGLVYKPGLNGNGDGYASFTFAVRDNGGTANGGSDTSAEHTMTINVVSVNDVPEAAGKTLPLVEDHKHVFSAEDFGFSDPEDGSAPNGLLGIWITATPSAGSLTLNGAPVAADTFVALADIGKLEYAPAANASGVGYASLRFKVQDDGGTANGGQDTSTEHTITFNVSADNDAPAVSGLSANVPVADNLTARPFASAVIQDVDSTSLTVTVSMDRTDLGGISRSTGFRANPDGTYTMTGTAAAVQGALRNLTFDPKDNVLVPGTVGTTRFTLKVSDGTDVTTSTVDVDITSINDLPVARADGPINVDEGAGFSAGAVSGVLANDTDADRDALTVSAVTFGGTAGTVGSAVVGTYGTLVLKADGSYTFVADQAAATALFAGQSGTDVFTYTVDDGHGGTATSTLTFKVNGTTLLIEGLELAKRTVTNADGSLTQTIDVPVVTNGGADGVIDVPVAKSATGQTILTATIPVGVGMQISGSPSAQGVQASASDLLKAIQARTQPGSADQASLTGGAQGFLSSLPANGSVLVQTVDISSAPTSGQPIAISGTPATAGSPKTAVVVDASHLPSGTVLKVDNVDFVMVIGAVRVTGGSGAQTAWGDGSGQWMVLGADDDVLHGGGGDDYVGSLGGNDQLFGDEGNDTLSGGDGNDTLDGGTGVDLMIGGAGDDTYVVDLADDVVVESKGQGTDTVISSVSYVLGANVENLTLRGDASYGYGNSLANVLRASEKGSLLYGWGGNDTLVGSEARDRLYGSSGNDKLYGRGGNDHINGGSGSDRLDGGAGNDTLVGEGGNDVLKGGDGNDTISAGSGNDVIHGGKGADVLYGSSGRDAFVFDTALGTGEVDTIRGFSRKYDTVRLEDSVFTKAGPKGWLKWDAFHVGSKAADAEDRIVYDRKTGALYYDKDGTGVAAQVKFAQLDKGLKLTHLDFFIV